MSHVSWLSMVYWHKAVLIFVLGGVFLAYQMTIRLTDQEYAVLAAEAAKAGKQPELLLHDMIQRLQMRSQNESQLAVRKLAERLYREGKILNLPDPQPLTAEEQAERKRLAQIFAGGTSASDMVIEDRGPS